MKYKKPLVLFLSLISLTVYSQKSDSAIDKKYAIGLMFSPDYSYRNLSSDGSASANFIIHSRDSSEKSKYNYTAGLSFMYLLTKNFILETGLYLSDKGYKGGFENLLAPSGATGSSTNDYSYYYVDIPIMANYFIKANKFRFYIKAGLVLNFFATATTVSTLSLSDGTSATYVSKHDPVLGGLDVSMNVGLGVSYDISKRVGIMIAPLYRRSITPIIAGTPVREYLYSFGVNTGVYYRF